MIELLINLFAFSILITLFGGVVLGIVAFFQNRGLRRRIFDLEAIHQKSSELNEPEPAPLQPAAQEDLEELEPTFKEESAATERAVTDQKIETPTSAKESVTSKAARKGIEWEKLLGVRGAAILGGVALVIAAILFYQHAVQEGWFDMHSKVWTGAIVGTACFLLQARLRAKGYIFVSNVLAGSGAVMHYAAAWAAFRLYHLISQPAGFGWMAIITVACCGLAVRHSSQLIAIFGLVGGFATPLLLATSDASALGLFSYILLLDVALLAIGRKKDWPWLSLLGLFGTTSSQLLWLLRGREEEAAIALIACGLFGLLYVVMGSGPKTSGFSARWKLGQVAGILIPFAIATHYARIVELGDNLQSIAFVAALLAGGATFAGRRLALPTLSLAGAAGAAAVTSTWLLSGVYEELSIYSFALYTGATSLVLALFDTWPKRTDSKEIHPAAVHSLILLFTFTYFTSDSTALPLWGVSLMLLIHVGISVWTRASLPALPVLAGLAAGITLFLYRVQHAHPGNPAYHSIPALIGAVALISGLLLTASITWRRHTAPRSLALAATLCVLPTLLHFQPWFGALPPHYYGALFLLVGIASCGAARSNFSTAYAALVLITSWQLFAETSPSLFQSLEWPIPFVFIGTLAVLGVLTLAPLLFKGSLQKSRALGIIAAFAPFFGLFSLLSLYEYRFGERGALLMLLALASLPFIGYLNQRSAASDGGLNRSKTTYLMSALFFLALAIPSELRNVSLDLRGFLDEWFQAGLSLAAVAWSLAARRRGSEHWQLAALALAALPGLYWTALYLEIDLFKRESGVLFNWFSYHYALTLLGLIVTLRSPLNFAQSDASTAMRRLKRGLLYFTGTLGCLLPFVWINLLVINAYAISDNIQLSINDVNGELVRSFSWASYAFILLMIGTKKKITALRWASLGFFFLTIGKVFLGDLGDLEGLQRISSFLGLAVCLIFVSLFYSRFVFRNDETAPSSA